MIRAALYYRVSTGEQDPEHQREPCRALVERKGWSWSPEHEIEEIASGARRKRPGWSRVLELVAAGEVQRVVAWSLDRVGRSLWAVSDAVRELDTAGAPLVTVREPWLELNLGAGDPMLADFFRRQLVNMFDFIAAFERQRLIDRTAEGTATARRRGKVFGRPRRIGGQALADAFDLRCEGKSWGAIQDELKKRHGRKWPRGTISRAVSRLQADV